MRILDIQVVNELISITTDISAEEVMPLSEVIEDNTLEGTEQPTEPEVTPDTPDAGEDTEGVEPPITDPVDPVEPENPSEPIEPVYTIKVYLDNLYNEDTLSDEDAKHEHVLFTNAENGVITIDTTTLESTLDLSAFIIRVTNYGSEVAESASKFYFNEQELYYREVELLNTYCSTCLDGALKDKMVLFIMKRQLLQYAIDNNLIQDLVNYYRDLARMLQIDLVTNGLNISLKRNTRCYRCSNQICKLCE